MNRKACHYAKIGKRPRAVVCQSGRIYAVPRTADVGGVSLALGLWVNPAAAQQPDAAPLPHRKLPRTWRPRSQLVSTFPATQRLPQADPAAGDDSGDKTGPWKISAAPGSDEAERANLRRTRSYLGQSRATRCWPPCKPAVRDGGRGPHRQPGKGSPGEPRKAAPSSA